MGLRFRRSIRICKGVKLNFSKSRPSVTFGTRGLRKTISASGKRTTSVGIPGTGISYVTKSSVKKRRKQNVKRVSTSNAALANANYGGDGMNYDESACTKNAMSPLKGEGNSYDEPPKKKGKTWLWVIGWIFIFPLPLTILLLRSKKINKVVKIVVLVIAWLFYLLIVLLFGGSGDNNTTQQTVAPTSEIEAVEANIKSLVFKNNDDVTVKIGKTIDNGYVMANVKSSKDFSSDDVVFVSENPEIATITFKSNDLTTSIYYEITGVDAGETDVYAMSSDGSVKSDVIHVIVSEPISVESIELSGYASELVVGETTKASTTITPADADDKAVAWASSDESVAAVDEKGIVTAISGGTTTITVSSRNGVESSFEINVDGTKK